MTVPRTCTKCGRAEPAISFYRPIGRICKDCHKVDAKAQRSKNIDRIREMDRERGRRPERRARMRGWVTRYHEKNPEKAAAHKAVKNALRRGDLVPGPCEQCGNQKVDAHHDDYTKPLEVRWLCRVHHMAVHAAMA